VTDLVLACGRDPLTWRITASRGGELREQTVRQREGEDPADEPSALPLVTHQPCRRSKARITAMYPVRVRTSASRTVKRARTWRWGVRQAMDGTVGPQPAGVGQGPSVAAIGLDPSRASGVHRGEVRVGNDHLVAEPSQTPRHPLALGRGLEEDAWCGSAARSAGLPGPGCRPGFPSCARRCQYVHGWPPSACGVDRRSLCGAQRTVCISVSLIGSTLIQTRELRGLRRGRSVRDSCTIEWRV
jgi:hypothetical protein